MSDFSPPFSPKFSMSLMSSVQVNLVHGGYTITSISVCAKVVLDCMSRLHSWADSDVFSVAASHFLNLHNEATMTEHADRSPSQHSDNQTVMQEFGSAAAALNVL